MEDDKLSLVKTLTAISRQKGWTDDEFLAALLFAVAKLDPELSESQCQTLIDAIEETD